MLWQLDSNPGRLCLHCCSVLPSCACFENEAGDLKTGQVKLCGGFSV